MLARDERVSQVEIASELIHRARSTRVVARDRQTTTQLLIAPLKADDVVPLPTVHGNRNLAQPFQRLLNIDVDGTVTLAGEIESVVYPCCHANILEFRLPAMEAEGG